VNTDGASETAAKLERRSPHYSHHNSYAQHGWLQRRAIWGHQAGDADDQFHDSMSRRGQMPGHFPGDLDDQIKHGQTTFNGNGRSWNNGPGVNGFEDYSDDDDNSYDEKAGDDDAARATETKSAPADKKKVQRKTAAKLVRRHFNHHHHDYDNHGFNQWEGAADDDASKVEKSASLGSSAATFGGKAKLVRRSYDDDSDDDSEDGDYGHGHGHGSHRVYRRPNRSHYGNGY